MKTEKRMHPIYKEYLKAKKKGVKIPQLMGKYQYFFSNSNGRISMINELGICASAYFWEIYCIEGDLFKDVERFSTKEKAIEKAKEYLRVDEIEEIIEEKLNKIKLNKIENELKINKI